MNSNADKANKLPLSGIRVLDLGRTFAAPFCTQMLADLGAEVIKFERKDRGDEMRYYGPPFIKDKNGKDIEISSYFIGANRNKKSIEIDLSKKGAQEIIKKLATSCDVFVENFKVGDLARYGLDYESIKKINPEIIYCSITGFGQTGPYAKRPGTDSVFQAMSGMMSITGEPGLPPMKIGLVISDLITGLYSAIGIISSIRSREILKGTGQHIDMSLLDVAVATMSHRAIDYLMSGEIPVPLGTSASGSAPAQTYKCKDGEINIQASADPKWEILCRVLNRPDLFSDEKYQSRATRFMNKEDLQIELEKTLANWNLQDIYELLVNNNIICAPIYNVKQSFEDPQIISRELTTNIVDTGGNILPIVKNPIRFSNTPIPEPKAPPLLGEHTNWVLKDLLQMDNEQIQSLKEEGAI